MSRRQPCASPLDALLATVDAIDQLRCDLALAQHVVADDLVEGEPANISKDVWAGLLRLLDRLDDQLDAVTTTIKSTAVVTR